MPEEGLLIVSAAESVVVLAPHDDHLFAREASTPSCFKFVEASGSPYKWQCLITGTARAQSFSPRASTEPEATAKTIDHCVTSVAGAACTVLACTM